MNYRYLNINDLAPASGAAAVVPTDGTTLPGGVTRFLYVGGTGDISVLFAGDVTPVTLKAVPVGTMLAARIAQVNATGTTATNLVALY
jgi:hypothetical protein